MRAILLSCGLNQEDHPAIRKEIANSIEQFNYNQEIPQALGYHDSTELAKYSNTT